MLRDPICREQVKKIIERKGGVGVPLVFHKWWGEGTEQKYGQALKQVGIDIPDDILTVTYQTPGTRVSPTADPNYRWAYTNSPAPASTGIDSDILLEDWRDLDRYLEEFPALSNQEGLFKEAAEQVGMNRDRYILGHWWYLFYERFWSIRGMQNVLMDFIDHPHQLKRLGKAILDLHITAIREFAKVGVDGIFTSDDLGSQRALMMSPAAFRKVLKPLFADIIAECHANHIHFWLHTCGNVTSILNDFIEIGLDVIHPIQAYTMDYKETVINYGGKITFLVGMDVQHLLPEGTPDQVRQGVRDIADIFRRPDGGFMLAAGNGIMPETPLANIRAFLEEAAMLSM